MERLIQRLEVARQALATFEELTGIAHPTTVERDAAIQRFEYTLEASWKCVQRYLLQVEKISSASPKAVTRTSRELGLLDDRQTVLALAMCDDRNLTSHTYNQALAQQLFGRLAGYSLLIRVWLDALETRLSADGDTGSYKE